MNANFEIVEVKGKKYTQFEDSKETRKFLKNMVLCSGGAVYKNEGKLVYVGVGAYGNLKEWYTKVFSNVNKNTLLVIN